MAKPNSLVMKIVFIGVPVLVGVALLPTNPSESMKVRPSTLRKPTKSVDPYAADRNVEKFPTVDGRVTNSFRPGIIPPSLTNSKDPWVYTGNIEVNGSKQALLENKTTGEAVFLSPGDIWRGFKLISIDGDSIVVTGPGGDVGGQAKLLSFSGASTGRPDIASGAEGAIGYSPE